MIMVGHEQLVEHVYVAFSDCYQRYIRYKPQQKIGTKNK